MEHVAQSWSELIDILYAESWNPTLQRFRSPFAFRGMIGADRDLSSGLIRLAAGHRNVPRLETALLRNFRKYAWGQGTGDSIWHWLALAQHRGLPTRLVDWTYSPFVALHFVTVDPATYSSDGIVYCINFVEANRLLPRRLRRILEDEQSDTFTVEMLDQVGDLRAFDALARRDPFVVFVEPPSLDARILTQFALFSLMSSPTERLDDWLLRHPEVVRTVRVPAALKWEVRDKLDQANINERTLLPGLDGLSKWLARYYRQAEPPTAPAAPAPRRARTPAARRRPTARAARTRRRG